MASTGIILVLLLLSLGLGWLLLNAYKEKAMLEKKISDVESNNDRLQRQIAINDKYARSLESQIRGLQQLLSSEKERRQALADETDILREKIGIYLGSEASYLGGVSPQAVSKEQVELLIANINKLSFENTRLLELIADKDRLYEGMVDRNSSDGVDISELIADHLTLQYELTERYLRTKPRPAIMQANDIKVLRKELREYIKKYKQLKYTFELLKTAVPVIDDFVEDDLIDLAETLSDDQYSEIDEVSNWVSKEEYENLDPLERNELALENYLLGKFRKSKWQIGRDYELFVGFTYEQAGYKVQYTGIQDKFTDQGRDLICTKDDEVLVIQCKYWSNQKVIRENAIAQLYGTTKMYELENGFLPGIVRKVEPILITNISLSSKAKQFADYLGVKVIDNFQIGLYPSIKCNISIGPDRKQNKIYHLPMDQMYDRTKIEEDGECMVMTVKQAEHLGFRRAKKFYKSGHLGS